MPGSGCTVRAPGHPAWYDNEWGFSNRLVQLAEHIAARPTI
ncbi:hypothetical protein [Microbispora bryophytorum]